MLKNSVTDSLLPVLFLCILLFLHYLLWITDLSRAELLTHAEDPKMPISGTNFSFQLHVLTSTCLEASYSSSDEGKFELYLEGK